MLQRTDRAVAARAVVETLAQCEFRLSRKAFGGVSELRQQTEELFAYIREVGGEIQTLEIRQGIPFAMEIDLAGARTTAAEGGHRD